MNKDTRYQLLTIILFPLIGLILLGLCFFIYYGVFRIVDSILTQPVKIGLLRQIFALTLVLGYLLILKLKISDRVKALLLIGPLGTFLITIILTFYQNIPLFASLVAAVVIAVIYLIYRFNKPWYFYYATILALLAALAYGWPRPM